MERFFEQNDETDSALTETLHPSTRAGPTTNLDVHTIEIKVDEKIPKHIDQ